MFLNIKDLYFKYNNSKEYTINKLNMNIDRGDVLAILGESGSGKSTILRLIAGLEEPLKGSISLNDNILMDKNTFIMPENREIGMVFQDYALFPHMTVSKNILFGLDKMNKKKKISRLNEVLKLIDMVEYKDRYPHELSGGQQQRIALARAIAPRPSVLLMDEPFSNLDADLKNKIRKELKEILNKADITTIFVTHNKEDARAIANKVIVLDKGIKINKGLVDNII
ncbi:ABC transporter ATP-binding protein [Clostridium sp. D2Q-11]|uniref:ABC-type quaternary amine transporter n=1 Tax=Anaeromonas frigoriresistens TaxID=2683708 RepID=A0A942UV29_9FIRM|nr:ABC transporter ATP-binding protein [Anaeromonas frigoriresistens]MBS4539128.1 ABC transporter ATP-binding protein [Anaeromonas frigoriresistens]